MVVSSLTISRQQTLLNVGTVFLCCPCTTKLLQALCWGTFTFFASPSRCVYVEVSAGI